MNDSFLLKKINAFFTKHFFVLVYFGFFVLATIPTILDSLSIGISSVVETSYKGLLMTILFVALFSYAIRKRIKISRNFVCLITILFITYLIYTILFPSIFYFVSPVYSFRPNELISIIFSKSMKIVSIFNLLSTLFFAFVSLSFAPSIKLNEEDLKLYLYLICVFVFLSCIYAFAFQSKSIFASGSYAIENPFSSFYGNKNTFGIFLIIAAFASGTLFYRFHLKRFAFYLIFFVAVSFLSRSTTAAILSTLIFVIIYILFIIKMFSSKKIAMISLLISPFLLLLFISTILVLKGIDTSFISSFLKKLGSLRFDNFYGIFSGRGGYWAFGISLINKNYALLGYPQPLLNCIIFESVVNRYMTRSLTSTYLTILDSFGVVGIMLYVYVLLLLFSNISKIEDFLIKEMFFLLFAIYIIYGAFETYALFDTKIGSIAFTPILVAFPMSLLEDKKFRINEREKRMQYSISI